MDADAHGKTPIVRFYLIRARSCCRHPGDKQAVNAPYVSCRRCAIDSLWCSQPFCHRND